MLEIKFGLLYRTNTAPITQDRSRIALYRTYSCLRPSLVAEDKHACHTVMGRKVYNSDTYAYQMPLVLPPSSISLKHFHTQNRVQQHLSASTPATDLCFPICRLSSARQRPVNRIDRRSSFVFHQ